jgi:hypothetical protein
MKLIPNNSSMGVRIEGIDLSKPIDERQFATILSRTLHNAIPDYRPDEHRLIKRCQVMADRVFDPAFVRQQLAHAAA